MAPDTFKASDPKSPPSATGTVAAAALPPARKPNFYLTVPEVEAEMRRLVERFPDLVRLEDLGDSFLKAQKDPAGHDILGLRLGKQSGARGQAKPRTLFIGGMHANETAPPELLLRWVRRLLESYETDPMSRSLLDTQEIMVVPLANPDGRAIVDEGYAKNDDAKFRQRKNAREVDLNRNFATGGWGTLETEKERGSFFYAGDRPASEPETQAIERLFKKLEPDLLIDLHSSGRAVLYPSAPSVEANARGERLAKVADRLRSFTGNYRAVPSNGWQYPFNGTSMQRADELGIPAFTIETDGLGTVLDDQDFEEAFDRLGLVLTVAALSSRDVFELAQGPVASVEPIVGGAVDSTLQAPEGEVIVAAEVVLDPKVPHGEGAPLRAVDGKLDSALEVVVGSLPGPLPADGTIAYVRGEDAGGHWGPDVPQFVRKRG